jgi:predicted Zn-dependent protease
MKKILTVAFAAIAAASIAQSPSGGNAPADKAALRKEALEKAMAKAGGFIDKPGEGAAIEIVDTRKDSDGSANRVKEVLDTMLRLPSVVEAAELAVGTNAYDFAVRKLNADKSLMVVLLVDSGQLPSLAVFPEDRVAVVNARKVKFGADEKDGRQRMIREIWRAIGFIGGTGYATTDNCVMQPIMSPLELDALEWQVLNPSNAPRMDKFLRKHKVRRGHRMTYRKAVEQGWAPPPTNDLQKAVWDEVKASNATNAVGKAAARSK